MSEVAIEKEVIHELKNCWAVKVQKRRYVRDGREIKDIVFSLLKDSQIVLAIQRVIGESQEGKVSDKINQVIFQISGCRAT